ncbi:Uncharacterised protein [uncultured archaeon]|nr:Uncharacterised protein [uncultured archaeon]
MIMIAVLWLISMFFLLLLAYSIALFYERTFKRNTYSYLFIISFIFYIFFALEYMNSLGILFFALGSMVLGVGSVRLHNVMTRRGK